MERDSKEYKRPPSFELKRPMGTGGTASFAAVSSRQRSTGETVGRAVLPTLPGKSSGLKRGYRDKINSAVKDLNKATDSKKKIKLRNKIHLKYVQWISKLGQDKIKNADKIEKIKKWWAEVEPMLEETDIPTVMSAPAVVSAPTTVVAPGPRPRTRRRQEDGPLYTTADQGQQLKDWIDEVGAMIVRGEFRNAYNELTNVVKANNFGITVKIIEGSGNPLGLAQKNMSFASEGAITLKLSNDLTWLDNADSAKKILPMHLEEYMHQYQARTNSFLSPHTAAFKGTNIVPDISDTRGIEDGDYDEIDVMAKLHDMGLNVEEIKYVERYEERGEFWEWFKKQPR
ncbi:hypothetical protein GCM10028819_10480 [Spirosoma humi]